MDYQIFIVEDHPVIRQAYMLMLEHEAGLVVCGMAETAEEALEFLRAMPCDLVLADMSLPGMDGIELIERLLVEHPALRVLVVSGHDEAVFGERARNAGARAYLNKHDLAETLVDTIRATLLA